MRLVAGVIGAGFEAGQQPSLFHRGLPMFHPRAVTLTAAGTLLLSACGGDAGSDVATGGAPATASSSGAIELKLKRGTARQNNTTQNTGDWANDAAPATVVKQPVVLYGRVRHHREERGATPK